MVACCSWRSLVLVAFDPQQAIFKATPRRAASVTLAPLLARKRAKCRPNLLEPPVTRMCRLLTSETRAIPRTRVQAISIEYPSGGPPLPLGLIPRRQRLQIRNPGKSGLAVGRYRLRRDDHVEQRWTIGERAFDRGAELFLGLDTLGMHSERPRHCSIVRILQPGADHLAVGDRLVMHLDLPGAVVGDDNQHRRLVANGGIDLDGVEAECAG